MEKETLGEGGFCEMYTQKQNKTTLKFRKIGLLGFSVSSNCSPIWGSNLPLKIFFFFCKRVQEITYKVSVHIASCILEKWTELSISLTLPLSCFHKNEVQGQPKWAFVALGWQVLWQHKGTTLEIPVHMLLWRLAVSSVGRFSCWKVCPLSLPPSLHSPVPWVCTQS